MKIYTKMGDTGETYLASGAKVSKSDPRVELYGTADELNSFIGLSLSSISSDSLLNSQLLKVQNLLFELGSELACFSQKGELQPMILEEDIFFLESCIDQLEEKNSPLKVFILPGGSAGASHLHIARTICRRLEREIVSEIQAGIQIRKEVLAFVNRLSDLLFVSARYCNLEQKISDIEWNSSRKK
jgi:cob(I)alamin adenosyltransferase